MEYIPGPSYKNQLLYLVVIWLVLIQSVYDAADCTDCSSGQFKCVNTNHVECVDNDRQCDGKLDCSDGSDEFLCVCTSDMFACFQLSGLTCITSMDRCNNRSDCTSGLDETNCDKKCNVDFLNVTVSNNNRTGDCVLHDQTLDCGQREDPTHPPTYSIEYIENLSEIVKANLTTNETMKLEFCFLRDLKNHTGSFWTNIRVSTGPSYNFTAMVPLLFNIIETNAPPVMSNTEIHISESESLGWRKAIDVYDPDDGRWGNLKVTLHGSYDKFELIKNNNNTWDLELVKPLDAEKDNMEYQIHITAEDGGGLTAKGLVIIVIYDSNDNRPICTDQLEKLSNIEIETTVASLSKICHDDDVTQANNQLSYKMVDVTSSCADAFKLAPDNTVRINKRLNEADKRCVLLVTVSDKDFQVNLTLPIKDLIGCLPDTDIKGMKWNLSSPNTSHSIPCDDNYEGFITRICSKDGNYLEPIYNCTRKNIALASEKVDDAINAIISGLDTNTTNINDALEGLSNATSSDIATMQVGGIKRVQSILERIGNYTTYSQLDKERSLNIKKIVGIASNILDTNNSLAWKSLVQSKGVGADRTIIALDKLAESMSESKRRVSCETRNIILHLQDTLNCTENVAFPNKDKDVPAWFNHRSSGLSLACQNASTSFSSIIYRNVSQLMSSRYLEANNSTNATSSESSKTEINSFVMSFTLYPSSKLLQTPITINFTVSDKSLKDPKCTYFETLESGQGTTRGWSSKGCRVIRFSDDEVGCECDHLSSFAVLMSPTEMSPKHARALNIITKVGCSITLLCTAMTALINIGLWWHIRSERVAILINLCVSLFLADLLFVTGIERTENEVACTAIAVGLHYLFLVLFFSMLSEGVYLGINVVRPLKKRKSSSVTIPAAWGVPVLLVAVPMGVTSLHGYGNKEYCWLSAKSGLIWAFIGPALLVVTINMVVIVLAFRRLCGTDALKKKSEKEKTIAGLRSLAVVMPIVGVTWILGVFGLHEDLFIFDYIFAILNSLQGLFIFLTNCICNRQIRALLSNRRKQLVGRCMATASDTPLKSKQTELSDEVTNNDSNGPVQNTPCKEVSHRPYRTNQITTTFS